MTSFRERTLRSRKRLLRDRFKGCGPRGAPA
jgi:hypothetical protein